MAHLDEITLDNLLIRQKNVIIGLCNDGKYDQAGAALTVVQPLWEASGYLYKYTEVQGRIIQGILADAI